MKRRDFIKAGAVTAVVCSCGGFAGCSAITGTSSTPEILEGSFSFNNDMISIDLSKIQPLSKVGGSAKLKIARKNQEDLKVIILRQTEDEFLVFSDRCTHGGRELEYLHDQEKLTCVSFGSSKFDLKGEVLSGPAKDPLKRFTIAKNNNTLEIAVS